MYKTLFEYRFTFFFVTQVAIVFGSLLMPNTLFESFFGPVFFLINVMAGIVLVSYKRQLLYATLFLLGIIVISHIVGGESTNTTSLWNYVRMSAYFVFHIIITRALIKQVWKAKEITRTTFLGLISGYLSLGFLGLFICLSIEMTYPGSFSNLLLEQNGQSIIERLLYFSYVTLLTLGYGDIVPLTSLAQKAAILISLMGQFYLVLLTATIIGKYINQFNRN